MEPVSFAASLVALLGAAGSTCEFTYNFILDIGQVPHEIQSQAIKLQCLHESISTLLDFYSRDDLPPGLKINPFLESKLRIFLDETRDVENQIKNRSKNLDESRTRRLWERVTWLSSDRTLRKFYASLDDWLKIFSTAVASTNLDLMMRIHNQIAAPQPSLPPYPEGVSHTEKLQLNHSNAYDRLVPSTLVQIDANEQRVLGTQCTGSDGEIILPKTLRAFLSQRMDAVGLKVQRWALVGLQELSADLRVGPAVVVSWSEKGKPIYKTLPWKKGIGVSSTLRDYQWFSKRLTITIFGIVQAPKVNITWNLSFRSMLDVTNPAYLACQKGDWALLRTLLKNGKVGISDSTGYGDTLLHIAVRSNHSQLVTALLQQGAQVDAENDFGETPLQTAVKENCKYDILNSLISSGADLSHQDVIGRTPIHYFFNESVRALLEFHGEDIDNTSQDAYGMNITQYVCGSKSSNLTDLFRCTGGNISSFEVTDEEGRTALHHACQRGNLELIEFLLDEQKDVIYLPDWQGRTLMHYATDSGRSAQVIELLASRGFDPRAVDHKGRTVLHDAASGRSVAAVEKLLELGAMDDLNALDKESRTPLQCAVLCGRTEVVELLRPLCGEEQLAVLANDQKAMSGHEGGRKLDIGSRFNAAFFILLAIGLVAYFFLQFVR